MGFMFLFIFLIYGLMFALCIASYVLQAVGMYRLAQYRKHKSPWWAWVPIANWLLLGDLTDDFILFKKNITGRKLVYIILGIYCSLLVAMVFLLLVCAVGAIMQEPLLIIFILIFYIFFIIAMLAMLAALYILYYYFYKTYKPENAALYLILSIFFSVSVPIIIFYLGNEVKRRIY